MARRQFLFMLIMLVLTEGSCGKRASIDHFDSVRWKNDRRGCAGDRMKMLSQVQQAMPQFAGMNRNAIISLLGRPEDLELHPKGQLIFRYHISPDRSCAMESQDSIAVLDVWVNALGVVSESRITKSSGEEK